MDVIADNELYYIYIDTKTTGAIKQLINYFSSGVFNNNSCISVLLKHYKKTEKKFKALLNAQSIKIKFIRNYSDLKLIEGKTIFYLFNAQSNCRMVTNRALTHIFVTHGESNKLASIKPIIRIYDYVITSGRLGIERYLKSGIFTEDDVERGRIIPMGNTFIGDNDFYYDENSSSIVYAPTWEGGIPEENYSSIDIKNADKIILFCQSYNIKIIYVQPHPNLGHRIKNMQSELKRLIHAIKRSKIKVILINNRPRITLIDKLFSLKMSSTPKEKINVKYALTDISAMEAQFIFKRIPCSVFINKKNIHSITIPTKLKQHYKEVFIADDNEFINMAPPITKDTYDYFFSYPSTIVNSTCKFKKIRWLCKHASRDKKLKSQEFKDKY